MAAAAARACVCGGAGARVCVVGSGCAGVRAVVGRGSTGFRSAKQSSRVLRRVVACVPACTCTAAEDCILRRAVCAELEHVQSKPYDSHSACEVDCAMQSVQSFPRTQATAGWHAWIKVQKSRVWPLAMHLAQPGWHEAQHWSTRCMPLYAASPVAAPTSVVKQLPAEASSCVLSAAQVGRRSLHSLSKALGEGVGAGVFGQQPYCAQHENSCARADGTQQQPCSLSLTWATEHLGESHFSSQENMTRVCKFPVRTGVHTTVRLMEISLPVHLAITFAIQKL